MSGEFTPHDPAERQRALLNLMQGSGLMRASELPARPAEPVPRVSPFESLYPDAELIRFEGCRCRRLVSTVGLGGEPTRQGYCCPPARAGEGGPPPADALAILAADERWRDLDPSQIFYLDTETTGLSGGSGTYVFLVGIGRFEAGGFVVEQYFMEDYADEPALLAALELALAPARGLVTYNGLGFDVPLLMTRWLMNRRRPSIPELHLDLLRPARRLWRGRLESCSLGSIERNILGIRRLSDVPGMLIPQIYFDFARGVRPERMVPVVDHHVQDIVSLGALAGLMAYALANPDDPRFDHASDQCGLWRLLWACGRREEGLARLEAATLAARDEEQAHRLSMRLARLYKGLGRIDDALAIWHARAGRLDPLIELAKHAEHTLKDHAAALGYTIRAMELLAQQADLAYHGAIEMPGHHQAAREAIQQRLARLRRKSMR
ncbi:ribonuclease H-like domain-containing protein [bacterium]|nr:ribonuclease H-like domain-containing protein [bacterium]